MFLSFKENVFLVLQPLPYNLFMFSSINTFLMQINSKCIFKTGQQYLKKESTGYCKSDNRLLSCAQFRTSKKSIFH